MDVSDIYLDMCKTATVIQKEHVIQAWDYYYGSKISKFCDSNPRIFVVSDYTTDGGVYGLGIEKSEQEDYELICWLPRQEM